MCKLQTRSDALSKKSKFWSNIKILVKNRNFGQKPKFWRIAGISVKNRTKMSSIIEHNERANKLTSRLYGCPFCLKYVFIINQLIRYITRSWQHIFKMQCIFSKILDFFKIGLDNWIGGINKLNCLIGIINIATGNFRISGRFKKIYSICANLKNGVTDDYILKNAEFTSYRYTVYTSSYLTYKVDNHEIC